MHRVRAPIINCSTVVFIFAVRRLFASTMFKNKWPKKKKKKKKKNININVSIWLLLDFKRLKAWLMAKPFNIVPGECAYSPSAATPQLREILCPWVKNAWRDQTRSTGCSHSHILVNVSLRYCVWGTRTQPLIALYTITKNRFCHLRPPAWLRQTLHSTPRLCMGKIRFRHENCS